jgi:hypothetical protein
MRMTLFPDQERTIAGLDRPRAPPSETGELVFRNVVIEKSRQIGETWLFAALLLWAALPPVQGLAMHQRPPRSPTAAGASRASSEDPVRL